MSERDSVAIRCARWEPPSYGYRLPNIQGTGTRHGPESVPLAKMSKRDIQTDNSRPQAGDWGQLLVRR